MPTPRFNEEVRDQLFPNSRLKGRANLYVCPNLDAANIGYNITRVMTEGVALGPILMGVSKPAHILTPAATVRRVVNMTAIAAVEAQIRARTSADGWLNQRRDRGPPWSRRACTKPTRAAKLRSLPGRRRCACRRSSRINVLATPR